MAELRGLFRLVYILGLDFAVCMVQAYWELPEDLQAALRENHRDRN